MSRKQKLSLNETAKKGSKKDVKLQQKRHQLPEKLENCLAFFPPRGPGTTIFMVVLEPSHIMTNIASQLLKKTQKCQKCVFWGSTLFVSKALEPNQLELVGSKKNQKMRIQLGLQRDALGMLLGIQVQPC